MAAASSSTAARDERAASALVSMPPVAAEAPRVLVLGSMPGTASLRAQRYYAHPRNLFWPMMALHLGIDARQPYEARMQALCARGVALWDVLACCRRRGSLDGAIARDSEVPNDIPGLLQRHPGIRAILLNGGRTVAMFRRHLADECTRLRPALRLHALPSTSPANQSIPLPERERAWSVIADYADAGTAATPSPRS